MLKMEFPASIRSIVIYNASFGTRELAVALLSAIRSVYSKPWLVTVNHHLEYDRDDILYIIICPAGLGLKDVKMPTYYINWQLEFMIGTYEATGYINRLRQGIYTWDYSEMNMEIVLQRENIPTLYVPPGFVETIPAPEILSGQYIYTDETKDIDILFLGYCDAYPRRRLMRDNLNRTGLNIQISSDLDLAGMQGMIRRAKVCINFATWDVFILAKIRLNILLSNQACVVSEASADSRDDELYAAGGVTIVPFDKIIETACDLVDDFDQRRTLALQSYQWYKNTRYWTRIVDFNSLLPTL